MCHRDAEGDISTSVQNTFPLLIVLFDAPRHIICGVTDVNNCCLMLKMNAAVVTLILLCKQHDEIILLNKLVIFGLVIINDVCPHFYSHTVFEVSLMR